MKKKIFLRGWEDYGNFYDYIESLNTYPDEIYIMTPEEVTPSCVYLDHNVGRQHIVMQSYKILLEFTQQHNIKLYIILGQSHDDRYNQTHTFFWNDYFMYWVAYENLSLPEYKKPTNPFISLNGRVTTGRCRFIDHFYKYDLFDKGYMSFSNNGYSNPHFECYKWKYWSKPELFFLDDLSMMEENNMNPNFTIPPEYFDSVFSFGSETKEHLVFVTEKTYLPIYFKKPFLLYAGKGQYAFLKSQGYELFENIIDYSFDDIEDNDERADAIAYQMKILTELDIDTLIEKTKNVCEHNYNTMMKKIKRKNIDKNIKRIISMCDTDEYDHYKSVLKW